MQSSQKPIKVAIASQKGGGGKSAVTLLLANVLCFNYNQKVLIVDCDTPQNTCANTRKDEIELLTRINEKESKEIKLSNDEKEMWKLFSKAIVDFPQLKDDFNVIVPNVARTNILNEVPGLLPELEKTPYKVILFDTVGTLGNPEALINLISKMDYVFVPIEAEAKALKAAITSLSAFNMIHKQTQQGEVSGFFNKLKIAEKDQSKCVRHVLTAAHQLNLPLLIKDNQPLYMEDKACFRNPYVQSTVIPAKYNAAFRNSEGMRMLDEMCKMILKK